MTIEEITSRTIQKVLEQATELRKYELATTGLDEKLVEISRDNLKKKSQELKSTYGAVLKGTPEGIYLDSLVEHYLAMDDNDETQNSITLWKNVKDTNQDPFDFYEKNYSGLSRGEVALADNALYQELRKSKQLKNIPKKKQIGKFGEDPLAFYNEHYAGLTRGQLIKENQSLYSCLHRKGLLESLPKQSRYGDDAVTFYQENYEGVTRGDLVKIDRPLYAKLHREGLLDVVPKSKVRRETKLRDFGDNLLEYYYENYNGVFRSKLSLLDPVLYTKLRESGQIEHVPTLKKKHEFSEDPVSFYNEHYAGITRGELAKVNQPLYQKLYKSKLLDVVPLSRKRKKVKLTE